MENYGYEKPVSNLLHIGKPDGYRDSEKWLDYVGEYGFTSEHISELKRLYEDETFQNSDYWDEPEGFAFVHVIRTLGQLQDKSAIPFLLHIAETEEDSDWIWEEIPIVLSLFGKEILPDLKDSMQRVRDNDIVDSTILNALDILAKQEPEIQTEVFEFWVELLSDYKKNDYGLNAHLICHLSEHKYEPALPLIEKAFKAKRVDEFFCGDHFDILVAYGLQEDDPNREKDYFGPSGEIFKRMREMHNQSQSPLDEPFDDVMQYRNPLDLMDTSNATKKKISKQKKKSKRKQAKKSRQKNRKKK